MKKLDKPCTTEQYAAFAVYANENGLKIEDKGNYFEAVEIPEPSFEEKNEVIRQTRGILMTTQADPLRFDYEEELARYGEADERTIATKNLWLVKKDNIRVNNPYIETVA